MTKQIEEPLDLLAHLPFRVAAVSNLLALNRDWKIREIANLDPREMRVLLNIGSYMPIKSADIAYQSRLDSYTVSRAVKKLLQLDLITTEPDSQKKNVKNLLLNEAGKVLYQKMKVALHERAKQLDDVLTDAEKTQFYGMLARIENKTEALLAEQASQFIAQGKVAPADQKELIRWHNKSVNDPTASG